MSYLKLAHDLVDGVHRGDLHAVAAAIAILCITALSGYATTMLTRWGARKGFQAFKWLITPKPMAGLARILLEALKRGDKETYNGGLLVNRRLVFTGKNAYGPGSICVVEPSVDAKDAKWTRVCHALDRRDRRRLMRLANWHSACLLQALDANSRKQAWAKGMEVAEQIAHPIVSIDKCEDKDGDYLFPPKCQCNPETGDTCHTCTGGPVEVEVSINGQAPHEKQPFEMCKANPRYECPGCREARKTKWKRDA